MARTETIHNMGIRLTYPDVFDHPKGQVSPMAFGDKGDGSYFMMYSYIAMSAEDLKALSSKSGEGMSKEDALKVADAMGSLLVVIGADSSLKPEEIIEKDQMHDASPDDFIETGSYGNVTYYAVINHNNDEQFTKEIKPEFAEEFRVLQKALIEALKNADYVSPSIPGAELVGKTLKFETKDIDGNPVTSEELFSAHDVTMINIWATWCGPCKKELEELGKMHLRLLEKNAAIVGICDDAAEKADDCKALIAEKNITYTNILPFEGAGELATEGFPTSLFVNREGTILTYPIIGVPGEISEYEKQIDALLAGESADTAAPAEASAEKKNTCRIFVSDTDGNPVAGVTVQFCSDITCMMGKTDAEGSASFAAEEGPYTVHVQKVPEGYETCTEEFTVPKDLADVKIILNKQ